MIYTRDDNVALILRYQSTHDQFILEELLRINKPLIKSIIYSFNIDKSMEEDLIQEGIIALLKCIENFSLEKAKSFSTYARPSIRGKILKYLNENKHSVYVKKEVREILVPKIVKYMAKYYEKDHRMPTSNEIAMKFNLTKEEYYEISCLLYKATSLNEVLPSQIGESYATYSDIYGYIEYIKKSSDKEEYEILYDCLSKLPKREQLIIKYYHGLAGYPPINFRDIAKILDISFQQVGKIYNRAFGKFCTLMHEAFTNEENKDLNEVMETSFTMIRVS